MTLKQWNNIQVGDEIVTYNGKREVIGVYMKRKKIVKISKFKKGFTILQAHQRKKIKKLIKKDTGEEILSFAHPDCKVDYEKEK